MKLKKIEIVLAVIWDGENMEEVFEFVGKGYSDRVWAEMHPDGSVDLMWRPNMQYAESRFIPTGSYIVKKEGNLYVWEDGPLMEGFEPCSD